MGVSVYTDIFHLWHGKQQQREGRRNEEEGKSYKEEAWVGGTKESDEEEKSERK